MFGNNVYIPCGKDFFKNIGNYNLISNLDKIAYAIKKDEQGNPLIIDGQVCYGRTRDYILRKANKFIADFDEVESDENMPSRISKRQFRFLNRAFKNKNGRITCYAMIIMHTIYCVLKNADIDIDTNDADIIKNIVCEYYRYYPKDDLAGFLIDCYEVTVNHPGESKSKEDFPPILKNRPKNSESEIV